MSYKIISKDGRCNLYVNGKLYCSGKTWVDVAKKFEKIKKKARV